MSAPIVSQVAPAVAVRAVDHVVLRSADPLASVEWWSRVLGLEGVRVDEFKAGKVPFPSVRVTSSFLIDFTGAEMAALAGPSGLAADADAAAAGATGAGAGGAALPPASGQMDHLCLCLEDGLDMDEVAGRLERAGAPPLPQFDGTVVGRFGARGSARSVYVRTPEGATLELRSYPAGWGA